MQGLTSMTTDDDRGDTDLYVGYGGTDEAPFEALARNTWPVPLSCKELMAIAVALTTRCTYCIEVHEQNALKAGATEEEFADTIHVAAALRAGAAVAHGTHLPQDR